MRSKRSYIESIRETSTCHLDLTNHASSDISPQVILPSKFLKTVNKVTNLPSPDKVHSFTRKKRSASVVLGNFMLSRDMKRLTKVATFGLVVSVVGIFVLGTHIAGFNEVADRANLVLVALFLLRFCLVAIAAGLKHIAVWTIIDSIVGFWAFTVTLFKTESEDTSYNSQYIDVFSRLFTIVFTLRLVFHMGNPKFQAKKVHPGHSRKIELVADKAQRILQEVLDEPWLHCKADLREDVVWCLEAIASDRLNQTIVIVDNSSVQQDLKEKDLMEIVNRYSQAADHSAHSVVLQRKNSEYPISGLTSELPLDLTDEIRQCFEQVDFPNFDVFQLKFATNNNELFTLANLLCKRQHLLNSVGVDLSRFARYASVIQDGYNSSILYHNATHAADVMQTYHYFVQCCDVEDILNLTPLEMFAGYVAAMVHDFQHPGVTNSFLVSTQAKWAIRYNDKSVLENHHVSAAFDVAASQDCNIYSDLSPEQYSYLRALMIAMVLATDPANHFSLLSRFNTKFTAFGISQDKDDHQLCLEVLLHSADISNPAKPWELCQKWAGLILNEFWLQGDNERKLGIPLSYLTDRSTANVPKSQIGFIDVIVEPLFVALRDVFPAVEELCENLCTNREKWRESGVNCTDSSCLKQSS